MLMINQTLKVFVTVVDKKSFTLAAESLHMSQPAVSNYIKKLEEELGVTLIDRSGKLLKLNPAGEIYYHYANEMIGIDERMQHLIQDLQNESKGPVHIGASYTYGEYILPKMIAQLIRRHPGIKPDVSISNSASIIRMVDSHDLDIGIIEDEERETDKNLNITRLIRDRMYIIGNRYTPDSLDNKARGGHLDCQGRWFRNKKLSGSAILLTRHQPGDHHSQQYTGCKEYRYERPGAYAPVALYRR